MTGAEIISSEAFGKLIANVEDMCRRLDRMEPELKTAVNEKADWSAVQEVTDKLQTKADAHELKEVRDELRKQLPLWVTFLIAAMSSVIGALIAAIYFLWTNYVLC